MSYGDIQALLEEPPGGNNHGRERRGEFKQDLSVEGAQSREFLSTGGYGMLDPRGGQTWQARGGTAHRGPLQEHEYVNDVALAALVERELGFAIADVRAVYRQVRGPLPRKLQGLRALIDARLLELSRAGANLALLARVVGLPLSSAGAGRGEKCWAFQRALERARKAAA